MSKPPERWIELNEVVLWESNANDGDVGAIMASIRKFGYNGALRIWRNKVVKGGNHSTKALRFLKKEGWQPFGDGIYAEGGKWFIRYLDISHLNEVESNAFGIADNQTTRLGHDDLDVLTGLLAEIHEYDTATFEATGFTGDDLDAMLQFLGSEMALDFSEIESPDETFSHDNFIWPSDNEWGVPSLNLHRQAKGIIQPFLKWGVEARSKSHSGSYHFYTEDYKFEGLWTNPSKIVQSGCKVVIEPNFSTHHQQAKAVALYDIWRKRWLGRYWQENGIQVLVDLNVEPIFDEINLLGVPLGWRVYATRCYVHMIDELERQYHLACTHAQTEDILFVVYGGRAETKILADKHGWLHFFEQASEVHDG